MKPRSLPSAWSTFALFFFNVSRFMPLASGAPPNEHSAFSAQAEALPFPPDARELAFKATFKEIEFQSGSSFASLAAFYRREMPHRGWTEDESAAESDEDSSEMTFKHDDAQVEIKLDARSSGVEVDLDCQGLDFGKTSDPAALIAAGVPKPRAHLFLQKEIPRPSEIQDVEYNGDACHFKSKLALQEAFDFYGKALKDLGWRESRRPIVTADRRYTEFKRGPVELSVNIFSHEVGSRIILGYKSDAKEPVVPPLAPVASDSPRRAMPGASGEARPDLPPQVAVDVSKNAGVATISLGSTKYVFKYVAAYRTKDDGEDKARLIFSERPIPWQRLQAQLTKDGDVSFIDLYPVDFPGHLTIDAGGYAGYSFNAGGVAIGDSIDNPDSDLKVENGRVHGAIKMREPKEVFDKSFQLAASIDASIMTPNTRLGGVPDQPALAARPPSFPGSDVLLPEGAGNVQSEGSQYAKSTHAEVDLDLKAVASFYRKELAAKGWKEVAAQSSSPLVIAETASTATMFFKHASGSMMVKLARDKDRTLIEIASQDDARAKQDGMLPEPGKGRIVMINGHSKDILITIGNSQYPLKAGQGSTDPKTALNYSVAPGKYELSINIPGQPPQSETLDVAAGTTWALFTLPTGEHLTNVVYRNAGEAPAAKNASAPK